MSREPRAVLLLLGLAVLGHAGRLLVGSRSGPPGQILTPEPAGHDPARQRARAERLARPLDPSEKLDVNTAPAEEIARLPRIGMSLAKRIVGDRTARGRFRGPEDLDRVPGVGPALIAALSDRLVFGGLEAALPPLEIGANPSTRGAYGGIPSGLPDGPVDLNSASLADLTALPGIGRARGRAILAYRRSHGSFAAVSDLGRVPGFSQSLVRRLESLVTVR